MSKFKVGDRVKFDYDGMADTGTIEKADHPNFLLIYMDNDTYGHHRDDKCWWVPPEKVTLLKSKTRRFL